MGDSSFIDFLPESERGTVEVVRAQSAVCWLSATFGDQREWSDFLSDCRRGKNVNFYGLQLRPCGHEREGRPLYRVLDLQDFAHQAKLAGAGEASFTVMHRDEYTRTLRRDLIIDAPVKEVRKLSDTLH